MIARIVTVLLCATLCAKAQIPTGYYSAAQGMGGAQLKTALHNIVSSGHNAIAWSDTWLAIESTDKKSNGKVWDVYSWKPSGAQPYEYTFTASNQCGNYTAEGDCYNREHVWPQSLFNSNLPMRSDLHSLLASDGWVNNGRADFPFGIVPNASTTYLQGCKKGTGSPTYPGYSGMTFEPIDSFKGDFARAILYFSTRYQGEDAGWGDWPMANGAELTANAIAILRNWHMLDPVNMKEINRNNVVHTLQGNRNPYIDYPEYVECVWGSSTDCSGLSVRHVSQERFIVRQTSTQLILPAKYASAQYAIYNTLGQKALQGAYAHSISTTLLPAGIYVLRIQNGFSQFLVQ